jgi:hypothetical protein
MVVRVSCSLSGDSHQSVSASPACVCGDEVAVDDCALVDVAVAACVTGRRKVLRGGARVVALIEQSGPGEAGRGPADGRNGNPGVEESPGGAGKGLSALSSCQLVVNYLSARRCGEGEWNACPAGLVPVPLGEALGLPIREKPRVRPAVVAHGQRAAAQVHDVHRVRMTELYAEPVIVVSSVRRCGSACCDGCHLCPISYLIHALPPLLLERPPRHCTVLPEQRSTPLTSFSRHPSYGGALSGVLAAR